MTKVSLIIFALFFLSLTSCDNHSSAPTQNTTTNAQTATPTASPTPGLSVAPTLATPSPGNTAAPTVVPNAKSKQAKGEQKALPPAIWDRVTRGLTLEEINKLPPETRDMILRAQGRLKPSPSPSPKKK